MKNTFVADSGEVSLQQTCAQIQTDAEGRADF